MPNEEVVGQIALKMVLNDTGYKRSLNDAEKRADTASTNMAAAFKKVGAAIAKAFTVAAVIKFGKDSVESAAKVQASNAQLAQTFGDLQTKAEAAMQAVADKSGILKTRLQGVGTDIFAFARTSLTDRNSKCFPASTVDRFIFLCLHLLFSQIRAFSPQSESPVHPAPGGPDPRNRPVPP